eukprot:m.1315995 g.1315995  ORF g.1315995 m.1315995 type:complete len:56 (+) comp24837_c1_seq4:5996-6163(+)
MGQVYHSAPEEHDACQQQMCDKEGKISVVPPSDAVAHPRAVMIEILDTIVAYPAM